MSGAQFELFLNCGAIVCAVMVFATLARYKRRRVAAILLSAGFLVMGILLLGLNWRWPDPVIGILAVVVGLLLVADLLVRMARRSQEPH